MNIIDVTVLIKNVVDKARLEIDGDILTFEHGDTRISTEDSILWVALIKLRDELENKGILLAVEGCRRDVHPSGMQLDMNTGSAYALTLGQTGGTVVDIFASPTSLELITTVEDQEEYHKKWIQSIKARG